MLNQVYLNNISLAQINVERVGVILFTIQQGILKLGLAIDYKTGELTDFGGKIKKRDRNPIEGALRELREETYNTCKFRLSDMKNNFIIFNHSMMILFVYINYIDINNLKRN